MSSPEDFDEDFDPNDVTKEQENEVIELLQDSRLDNNEFHTSFLAKSREARGKWTSESGVIPALHPSSLKD